VLFHSKCEQEGVYSFPHYYYYFHYYCSYCVLLVCCAFQKQALLQSVSYTNNGKTATVEEQTNVLRLVEQLESAFIPTDIFAMDPSILNGTWYLQYTSPSTVGDVEQFPDAWKPATTTTNKSPPTAKIVKGSITAAGVRLDVANRRVQQLLDLNAQRVTNIIATNGGTQLVGGSVSGRFRPSELVRNRVVVEFDTATIQLFGGGLSLNFGGIFRLLALGRADKDGTWLDTTYVDESLRIGRGNKGVRTYVCVWMGLHAC
jgi:hypothetical protein